MALDDATIHAIQMGDDIIQFVALIEWILDSDIDLSEVAIISKVLDDFNGPLAEGASVVLIFNPLLDAVKAVLVRARFNDG